MTYICDDFAASFNAAESGNLSTLFDVGGIIGGVIAGVISDYSGMSATTCAGMLTVAVPMVRSSFFYLVFVCLKTKLSRLRFKPIVLLFF